MDPVSSNSYSTIPYPIAFFEHLPNELVVNIFAHLTPKERSLSYLVCKKWQQAFLDTRLYRPKMQTLCPVFFRGVQLHDWSDKDGYLFLKLSKLTSEMLGKPSVFPPSLIFGPYCFSVNESTDVLITYEGIAKVILEGEKNKKAICLALGEPFLFILRDDGTIAQWNFQTESFVRYLKTSLYHNPLNPYKNLSPPLSKSFTPYMMAENGVLVLKYGSRDFIDLILYEEGCLVQRIDTKADGYLKKCLMSKDKIYLIFSKNTVHVWNIAQKQLEAPLEPPRPFNFLQNHFLDGDIYDNQLMLMKDAYPFSTFFKIDLTSKKIEEIKTASKKRFDKIACFHHLLFGFQEKKFSLSLVDLNTKTLIGTFNHQFLHSIKQTDLIKHLMDLAKRRIGASEGTLSCTLV